MTLAGTPIVGRPIFEPLGEWAEQAACVGSPPEWFDYIDNLDPDPGARIVNQRRAALKCASCPVRTQCALDAIRNDLVGVWGGYNFRQPGVRGDDLTVQTSRWWAERHRKAVALVAGRVTA